MEHALKRWLGMPLRAILTLFVFVLAVPAMLIGWLLFFIDWWEIKRECKEAWEFVWEGK